MTTRKKARFRVGQVVICRYADIGNNLYEGHPVKIKGIDSSTDTILYNVSGCYGGAAEKRFRPLTARERGQGKGRRK